MNNSDRQKLFKMVATVMGIILVIFLLTLYEKKNNMTLDEYAAAHPELQTGSQEQPEGN